MTTDIDELAALYEATRNSRATNEEMFAYMDMADEAMPALLAAAREAAELRKLLKRIHGWDHMDSAADGPYWRSEIDKATNADQLFAANASEKGKD